MGTHTGCFGHIEVLEHRIKNLSAKLQLATLALERYEKEEGHCHHNEKNENVCFCFQQTAQRVLYQIRDESPAGPTLGEKK